VYVRVNKCCELSDHTSYCISQGATGLEKKISQNKPELQIEKIMLTLKRGKPKYPEKNLLEQGQEPTTNSTHIIMMPSPAIQPGPRWWEASVLTTAPSLLPSRRPECW